MAMNTGATFVALCAIWAALSTPVARADDSDDQGDDPGYSIVGSTPGVESWPPVCADFPLACGLRFQPGPNTWRRPDPEPYH
jgi:hypothetical protein